MNSLNTFNPDAPILPILCILFFLLLPVDAFSAEKTFPFKPGEKITYQLKWLFFPAGKATLEVLPMEKIDGALAHHFRLVVRSNGFVDRFYKVRDRIDAFADKAMERSMGYRKSQKEGRTQREVSVEFDWEHQTARYANFNHIRPPIPVLPGTFDPLSSLYHVRFFDMKQGMKIQRPVSDGKKCVMGRLTVAGREQIRVGGRDFDTWRLLPELKHVGGVFEKSKNASIIIWVTADAHRIPVRVKSRVIIGSFTGDMVSADGL